MFWQADHVRLYGLDITDRLIEAGFEVETVFGDQLVASEELVRTGIYSRDLVYMCRER